jgi:type II secretory pathway pseudopilin PulG
MIVVAILGVLAAVAVAAYNSYIRESHNAEATSILADIRLKQEAYRGTFHQYADAFRDSDHCTDWVPNGTPDYQAHPGTITGACGDDWRQLGVSLPNNVYFGYDIVAGPPHVASPTDRYTEANPSSELDDFWYGAAAIQDLDNNSKCGGFRVVSGNMGMLEIPESQAACTF